MKSIPRNLLVSVIISLCILLLPVSTIRLEAATKEKKNRSSDSKKKKKKDTKDKDTKKKKKKGRYILRKSYYKVRQGESLRQIAKRLNVPYATLLKMNRSGLKGNKLKPGMKLTYMSKKKRVRFYGRLYNGVQLETGSGYEIRNSLYSWGTPTTCKLIKFIYGEMDKLYPSSAPALICDMSRQLGGPLKGHVSHQIGIDADLSIYRKGNLPTNGMTKMTPATMDIKKNLDFVKLLYNSKMVQYIFLDYSLQRPLYDAARSQGWSDLMLSQIFQYPRKPGSRNGIIRHWKGHDDHFHVRFSSRPLEYNEFITSPEEMEENDEEEIDTQEDTVDPTSPPDPLRTASIGTPTNGRLLAGVPLDNDSKYRLLYPDYIYTTPEVKTLLVNAITEFKQSFSSSSPLLIGKISKAGGGPIPGCIGHQNGLEIEIGFYSNGKSSDDLREIEAEELALKENWCLIQKLIDTNKIEAIFMDYNFQRLFYDYAKKAGLGQDKLREYFQYPMGSSSMQGLIRSIPDKVTGLGSKSGFQVRFKPATTTKK